MRISWEKCDFGKNLESILIYYLTIKSLPIKYYTCKRQSRAKKQSEPQAQGEMMMTNTALENAIARSISHNEIVHCEFTGEYSDLKAWLNDNVSVETTVSEELDGSIDVAGDDWRVNVTLIG